jgi:anti-sigma B factor antagonist
MKVRRRQVGDTDVLSFEGEFDASTVHAVSEIDRLIEEGRHRFVFSFAALTFIASPVLGYFVKTAKRLRGLGGTVVFSRPSQFMQATIRTLGLDQIFDIFPDDQAALAHLRAREPGSIPVDDRLLRATEIRFGLADGAGKAAVGRIVAIHEDGATLKYPSDPDRMAIEREDLAVGRRLRIVLPEVLPGGGRPLEMEIAEVEDAGDASRYRLRHAREADRGLLLRAFGGESGRDADAPDR